MEAELRQHLQFLAAAYVAAAGVGISNVGRAAAKDPDFFKRIDSGGFTVRKYDEVVGWFSENWPAGLAWPAAIPRPEKVAA